MPSLVPELSVSDIRASRHFYCDVLGFSLRYERAADGFACLAMGSAELMLDQTGIGRDCSTGAIEHPYGRGMNLQIEVAEIDLILARLDAASIALFQQLETKTYETASGPAVQRQFCVQDPDGYLLRFFERA